MSQIFQNFLRMFDNLVFMERIILGEQIDLENFYIEPNKHLINLNKKKSTLSKFNSISSKIFPLFISELV